MLTPSSFSAGTESDKSSSFIAAFARVSRSRIGRAVRLFPTSRYSTVPAIGNPKITRSHSVLYVLSSWLEMIYSTYRKAQNVSAALSTAAYGASQRISRVNHSA